MITADQMLEGRAAILDAADHHPYARHSLWRGDEPRGYRRDGAVLWLLPAEYGPAGGAIGEPGPAVEVFATLAVSPARRGRGLGAALTAGMTRALFDRYDHVALGVYTDNVGAIRLYRRLGFTGSLPRTSVHLG